MVPWSTIRPVILSLLTDIAVDQIKSAGDVHLPLETPEWAAAWKTRSVPMIHPLQKVALYLHLTSTVQIGWDDYRREELDTGLVAGGDASNVLDMYETVSGLRRFTLNLQAFVPAEEDAFFAQAILDRIRTYMEFTSSRARLLDVNVDYTDCTPTRDISGTRDKRVWSIATMDLIFTAAINTVDPIPVGWIERIILTSHEQLAPGEDVQASLRMVEEALPPLP